MDLNDAIKINLDRKGQLDGIRNDLRLAVSNYCYNHNVPSSSSHERRRSRTTIRENRNRNHNPYPTRYQPVAETTETETKTETKTGSEINHWNGYDPHVDLRQQVDVHVDMDVDMDVNILAEEVVSSLKKNGRMDAILATLRSKLSRSFSTK